MPGSDPLSNDVAQQNAVIQAAATLASALILIQGSQNSTAQDLMAMFNQFRQMIGNQI